MTQAAASRCRPIEPTTRHGILLGLRLALAHHPLCCWFRDDVFGRRLPVCAGCAVAVPAFLAALPLVAAGHVHAGWGPLWMVGSGVLLGVPQASTLAWRGPRSWRAVVKAAGGVGLALVAVGGLLAPVGWMLKAAGVAALTAAAACFLALRMRSVLATCDSCPWRRDWAHCPGFGNH